MSSRPGSSISRPQPLQVLLGLCREPPKLLCRLQRGVNLIGIMLVGQWSIKRCKRVRTKHYLRDVTQTSRLLRPKSLLRHHLEAKLSGFRIDPQRIDPRRQRLKLLWLPLLLLAYETGPKMSSWQQNTCLLRQNLA